MGDDRVFDLMMLLNQLEDLRDDMIELGVATIADIERRMQELESQLDDLPDGDGNGSV